VLADDQGRSATTRMRWCRCATDHPTARRFLAGSRRRSGAAVTQPTLRGLRNDAPLRPACWVSDSLLPRGVNRRKGTTPREQRPGRLHDDNNPIGNSPDAGFVLSVPELRLDDPTPSATRASSDAQGKLTSGTRRSRWPTCSRSKAITCCAWRNFEDRGFYPRHRRPRRTPRRTCSATGRRSVTTADGLTTSDPKSAATTDATLSQSGLLLFHTFSPSSSQRLDDDFAWCRRRVSRSPATWAEIRGMIFMLSNRARTRSVKRSKTFTW